MYINKMLKTRINLENLSNQRQPIDIQCGVTYARIVKYIRAIFFELC